MGRLRPANYPRGLPSVSLLVQWYKREHFVEEFVTRMQRCGSN